MTEEILKHNKQLTELIEPEIIKANLSTYSGENTADSWYVDLLNDSVSGFTDMKIKHNISEEELENFRNNLNIVLDKTARDFGLKQTIYK